MIIIDTLDKYKRLQRRLHKAVAYEIDSEPNMGTCEWILKNLERQQADFGFPIIISDDDYNELHMVERSYER